MISGFFKKLSCLSAAQKEKIATHLIVFVIAGLYTLLDELYPNLFTKRGSKKALLRESQDSAYIVEDIEFSQLSDNELSEMTAILRSRIEGNDIIENDDIMVEAFATAKEAAKRVLNIRFDSHQIFCEIACIRNAASGNKHSLLECSEVGTTVLSYYFLAIMNRAYVSCENEDEIVIKSKYMDKLFKFFGLSTGCILHNMSDDVRKKQYDHDVIYYLKSMEDVIKSDILSKRVSIRNSI